MSDLKQKIYCNQPETQTREARWLVFFDKDKLTFNQNLKGELPPMEDFLFKVRVNVVSKFGRKTNRKQKAFNPYIDVKLVEAFFPVKSNDIKELEGFEQRKAYVVLLITNDDIQVFGNELEPMSFRIEDKVADNGSGVDHHLLIVEGATTIKTKRASLSDI